MNEKTQNKDEIVEQLYGLRAGLSLISVEHDRLVSQVKQNISEIESLPKPGYEEISGFHETVHSEYDIRQKIHHEASQIYDFDEQEELHEKERKKIKVEYYINPRTYDQIIEAIENDISNCEENINKRNEVDISELQKNKTKIINQETAVTLSFYIFTVLASIAGVLAVGAFAIGLLVSLFSPVGSNAYEKFVSFASVSIIPAAIFGLIAYISYKIKDNVGINSQVQRQIDTVTEASRCEASLELLNQYHETYMKCRTNIINNDARTMSNEIYNALVDEYASLINPVDWENLDLIIFYFETGRANNIQEALIQVDRQRQTDEIVNTIHEASNRICNTINYNFRRLENTVIKCTSLISQQLSSVNQNIISMTNSLTAFKNKADTTSNELMHHVKQMRILAENDAIEKRNR